MQGYLMSLGRWFGVAAVLAVVLDATPTYGQVDESKDEARRLSEQGQEAYESGSYLDAAEAFMDANRHFPHANNVFNAAKAYEMAAEYKKAVQAYRLYLELFEEANGTPAPDEANILRTIEVLGEKAFLALPEVRLDSEPVGADIYIDDRTRVLGQTPFTVHLEPGNHKVFLKKAGYQSFEREFVVRSREPLHLSFALEKIRNEGRLRFKVNIKKARIYIDGKVQAVTPYEEDLHVESGQHQVMIEKDRYNQVTRLVYVPTGGVVDIEADLYLTNPPFSWRGGIGITSMLLGAGALGVSIGYLRTLPKNMRAFKGDSVFNTIETWTYVAYGLGGALLATGIGLVAWEYTREEVDSWDDISGRDSGTPPIVLGTDGKGVFIGASGTF